MKYLKVLSLLLALAVVASLFNVALAQDGGDANKLQLVMDADNAVIQHGEAGEWDGRHIVPAAIVYHDGLYHMFRNGYPTWPAPSSVAYATSEDGITWTDVQEELVFNHEDSPFTVEMNLINSVIVTEDGTWLFYFTFFSQDPGAITGVAVASATSPTDEWVFVEELAISAGGEDE